MNNFRRLSTLGAGLVLSALAFAVTAPSAFAIIPGPTHPKTVGAVGEKVSGSAEPVTGYAYVCDGAALVQEVVEHNGDQVVVTGRVEGPNSASKIFEVFQASRPEKCASMAAPLSGAVPGTLLVAVTWAAPHLGMVPATAGQSAAQQTVSNVQGHPVATGPASVPLTQGPGKARPHGGPGRHARHAARRQPDPAPVLPAAGHAGIMPA